MKFSKDEMKTMKYLRGIGNSYQAIGKAVNRDKASVYRALNPGYKRPTTTTTTTTHDDLITKVVTNLLSDYNAEFYDDAFKLLRDIFNTARPEAQLAAILATKLIYENRDTWGNRLTSTVALEFASHRLAAFNSIKGLGFDQASDPSAEFLEGMAAKLGDAIGLNWSLRNQILADIGVNDVAYEDSIQYLRDTLNKVDLNDVDWDVIRDHATTCEKVQFINDGLVNALKLQGEDMHRAHTRLIRDAIARFA